MPTVPAVPDALAVVRVHADRLHDAVRRWGCGPDDAVAVVQAASLDLVEAVDRTRDRPAAVGDPVGWLFALGQVLARPLAGAGSRPTVVAVDDPDQLGIAQALDALPDRQRTAVLLRDCYDLPPPAVAAGVSLGEDDAMELVAAARPAFLQLLTGPSPPSPAPPGAAARPGGHRPELSSLARLAGGGTAAARDATVRRHVQSCGACSAVLAEQEQARRLLGGLTVVELPPTARGRLLELVAARTGELAPLALGGPVRITAERDRLLPLPLVALGLLLALGGGTALGVWTGRDPDGASAAQLTGVPLVTAPPPRTLPAAGRPRVPLLPTPAPPHVFFLTLSPAPSTPPPATPVPTSTAPASSSPSPTGTLSPSPSPSPSASSPSPSAQPLNLAVSPASGPRNTVIAVTGGGWPPGSTVRLTYRELGGRARDHGTATADRRGSFTGTLTAKGTRRGHYLVTAVSGAASATAGFSQTP